MASELDEEISEFIGRFENIVYVSFGTMFMPTDEQMLLILDAIKLDRDGKTGYIISLKNIVDSYAQIERAHL